MTAGESLGRSHTAHRSSGTSQPSHTCDTVTTVSIFPALMPFFASHGDIHLVNWSLPLVQRTAGIHNLHNLCFTHSACPIEAQKNTAGNLLNPCSLNIFRFTCIYSSIALSE